MNFHEQTVYRDQVRRWARGETEPPAGVYVVKAAKEKGIPVIFCTDTYHHGDMTEPIFSWVQELDRNVVTVDANRYDDLDDNKNGVSNKKKWKDAHKWITWAIEGKLNF